MNKNAWLKDYGLWVGMILTETDVVTARDLEPEEYIRQTYTDGESDLVSDNLTAVRKFLETFYRSARVAKFLAELMSEK